MRREQVVECLATEAVPGHSTLFIALEQNSQPIIGQEVPFNSEEPASTANTSHGADWRRRNHRRRSGVCGTWCCRTAFRDPDHSRFAPSECVNPLEVDHSLAGACKANRTFLARQIHALR